MHFLQQQFNELTSHVGSFSEQWRLLVILSCLLLFLLFINRSLLSCLWGDSKKQRLYRLLPSPVTSPILGYILGHLEVYWSVKLKKLSLTVCFHHMVNEVVRPMQQAGESLFLLRLGPFKKLVMVIKGDAARALLGNGKHLQRAPEYGFFKEFLGESLLTGSVAKWKVRRKLLAPSFHLEILHKFLPAMNTHSRAFCSVIASKMDPLTGQTLLPDIRQLTASCTQDILCETIMGVRLNTQTSGAMSQAATGTTPFTELICTGVDLFCERVMTPWLYPHFLYRHSALGRKIAQGISSVRHYTSSLIEERKRLLSRQMDSSCRTVQHARARLTEGKRLPFLDLLLVNHLKGGEEEESLSLTAISNEVLEFLIAGIDTTSTTLQMALHLLGRHPDKQALIHQELDGIFAYGDDRQISLEDICQMTYLEMCIKEILRLYPAVPLVGRTLSEDLQMDNYLVPMGTTVYVNIAAINRDPQVWTKAEQFLPERFSPDSTEGAGHSNGRYLSFSAGPRNCIGSRFAMLNLKIVLATLLRHYTIHSLTAQEDIQLGFFAFAKPHAPIAIEFTQRKVNALFK